MENTVTSELMGQFHQCMHLIRHRATSDQRGSEEGAAHKGQGRLLCLLLERDGLSHTEIVEALDIRPPSVTELVVRLELSGQVYRSVNEADKRVSNVYLTEKGQKNAQILSEQRQADVDAVFAVLDAEEQAQLSTLLGKLIDSLKDADAHNREDFHSKRERRHRGHKRHGSDGGHRGHGGHYHE